MGFVRLILVGVFTGIYVRKLSYQKISFFIIDFFHNPSNNPKTTIKINQRTDQIKA